MILTEAVLEPRPTKLVSSVKSFIRVHSRPFVVSFLSALCALLRLFICDRGAPTELRLPFLACRARTLGRRNRFRPNETALKEIDQRSAIGAF
jgi:hypothetical protein